MIARPVCLLFITAWLIPPALAQFQLFSLDGSTERPVQPVYDFGTIFTGEAASARFRVRNTSAAPATLNVLTVGGTGFSLGTAPLLPLTMNPQTAVDFSVNFLVFNSGGYSATLRLVGISSLLVVSVRPGLAIGVQTPAGLQLLETAPVDFGSVELGQGNTRHFEIANSTAGVLSVPEIQLQSSDFGLTRIPMHGSLGPGEQTAFDVEFHPAASGARSAILGLGARSSRLSGIGLMPPLPIPRLQIDVSESGSARQGGARVTFDTAAITSGTGTVTLDFRPARTGASDSAVAFASGGRTAQFTVGIGDTQAHFGGLPTALFQTGTTAGALVFTVNFGGRTDEQTLRIAPAPVGIISAQAIRSAGTIELRVTGFDNTGTAGQLTFAFFDNAGRAIPPGLIATDATPEFARYFESSDVGGSFQLRATFPVNGDASRIAFFEAGLTNSAGTTPAVRTPF